jgi:hypothetical protein
MVIRIVGRNHRSTSYTSRELEREAQRVARECGRALDNYSVEVFEHGYTRLVVALAASDKYPANYATVAL